MTKSEGYAAIIEELKELNRNVNGEPNSGSKPIREMLEAQSRHMETIAKRSEERDEDHEQRIASLEKTRNNHRTVGKWFVKFAGVGTTIGSVAFWEKIKAFFIGIFN